MSYNQDFFELYKNYLQEPIVRKTHDTMFRTFGQLFPADSFNVIEFGCGQCCEYREFGTSNRWFGFDLDPPNRMNTYECDYRKLTKEGIENLVPFPVYSFVSIFSTECCMDKWEKYSFYRMIFRNHPIQAALVSGFYYEDKIKEELVKETGGIVSWQSIEDQRDFICDEFIEWRTCRYVPSKMFGDRVVEVWKLLIRNG